MPIYSLTKEKIDEFNDKHNNMTSQMSALKGKDTADLLYYDLQDIQGELKEIETTYLTESVEKIQKNTIKKKK